MITIKPASPITAAFEKKVRLSKAALVMEAAWPRLWLLVGLALLFVGVSMFGLWPALPELAHKIVLGLFGVAALAILLSLARIHSPTRDAAIRRIEQRSGVPHRPASAYEDTVAVENSDPDSAHIWAAHKSRLSDALGRLRVGGPSPRNASGSRRSVRGEGPPTRRRPRASESRDLWAAQMWAETGSLFSTATVSS
jgi:hypothetical protein